MFLIFLYHYFSPFHAHFCCPFIQWYSLVHFSKLLSFADYHVVLNLYLWLKTASHGGGYHECFDLTCQSQHGWNTTVTSAWSNSEYFLIKPICCYLEIVRWLFSPTIQFEFPYYWKWLMMAQLINFFIILHALFGVCGACEYSDILCTVKH